LSTPLILKLLATRNDRIRNFPNSLENPGPERRIEEGREEKALQHDKSRWQLNFSSSFRRRATVRKVRLAQVDYPGSEICSSSIG
jgi:hypothetical protein